MSSHTHTERVFALGAGDGNGSYLCNVEPSIKFTLNKGHNRKCLSTKEILLALKHNLPMADKYV